jgi:ankyrin repeat protein
MDTEKIFQKYRNLEIFLPYGIKSFEDPGMDGDTPVHAAAYMGDIEALRVMLPLVSSVELRGGIGNSPLHLAILGGNPDAVEVLLAAGADLFCENDYGDKPSDFIDKNASEIAEVINRYTHSLAESKETKGHPSS